MKRSQIMIVVVAVAVFWAVCSDAQNSTIVPDVTTLAGNQTDENTTVATPTTVLPISSAPVTTENITTSVSPTTATTPDDTTTASSSLAPTSGPPEPPTTAPFVSTTADNKTAEVTTGEHCPPPHGFDGASFVGGIVLALGVIIILVIIVKCYNHQTQKNELHYSQF